jgi:hypothetical protein
MPKEFELVLDLDIEEPPNRQVCNYYFVNAENCTLFWPENFNVKSLLHSLHEFTSLQHICESRIFELSFTSVTVDCRTRVGKLLLVSFCRKISSMEANHSQESLGKVPPQPTSRKTNPARTHGDYNSCWSW